MNEMERQYRASLRWYSKKWRNSHGEALLDTLLAGAEAQQRNRPSRAEKVNLALRGSAERLFAAVPAALFVLALLALLVLLSVAGVAPGASITVSVPSMPTPQPGQLYSRFSTAVLIAGWVQAVSVAIFLTGGVLGVVVLRRVQRLRKVSPSAPSHH